MHRIIAIVLGAIGAAAALDIVASDQIASGPRNPSPPVDTFCYAFGSAKDGSATTYFTGIFLATTNDLIGAQAQLRQFLSAQYGSQPDPRSGDRDVTCVMPPSGTDAAGAQQYASNYASNMRRGGGTVVETGWQFAPPTHP